MNIVIYGYGSIGKHYYSLLDKKIFKNIYIVDKIFSQTIRKKNVHFIDDIHFKKITNNFNYAIICTPSNLHFQHAKYFLNKKTNVLIEKPFVLKFSHAKSLILLSKKNKVRCWTVFQNRLNEPVILLKSLLQKNFFGKLQLIHCNLLWSRDKKYYSDDWHGRYKSDGGVLTNQAIHLLDVLIYLFGKIENFQGNLKFNKKKLESEDFISLNITLSNNLPVSFLATTRSNKDYEMSIDVFGSTKRLKVGGLALNKINFFDKNLNKKYANKNFITKHGFGNKHKILLSNFLNLKNKDLFNLSIEKNHYLIKVINSIYFHLSDVNNFKVNKNRSILGYDKKK